MDMSDAADAADAAEDEIDLPKMPEGEAVAVWPSARAMARIAYNAEANAHVVLTGGELVVRWCELSDLRQAMLVELVESILDDDMAALEAVEQEWSRMSDGRKRGVLASVATTTFQAVVQALSEDPT